jgi:hypothetical protein
MWIFRQSRPSFGAIGKRLMISLFEWYDFYDKTLLTGRLGLFSILF